MKTRIFSAVLSAFMLASASVGVTAYAEETAASSAVDTVEATTENSATTANETDISSETTTVAPETIPDFYGDPYYDTDGNASLIKSESIIYNTEEMQFIAVTTKDGHVFYVLINYSAASGEDSVYFLNKVDDYDLYALLYAGEGNDESGGITPEVAAQAAEEANGRVKPKTDSDKTDTAETSEDNEESSEVEEQPKSAPMNMNSIYLVFGAIALIGIGAAGFMLTKKKSKSQSVSADEPDDEEEEIYIKEDEVCIKEDEEDFNFYDDNQDE